MSPIVLRLPGVRELTSQSKSALYQQMADGLFPMPIRLGTRAVAWPVSEVHQVIKARIAGLSDAQIRQVVRKLARDRLLGVSDDATKA